MITFKGQNISPILKFDLLPSLVSGSIAFIKEEDLEGFTSLKANAFRGCTELKDVALPKGLTTIGENAFADCTALKSIIVAEDNPNYLSQDGILYDKPVTKIIAAPLDLTGDVVIAEGITSINLKIRKNLTGLVLPQTLTKIEDSGLSGLSSVKRLVIPKNVTYIGMAAFVNSDLREGLIFETTNLKTMPQAAFSYSKIVELELPEGLEKLGDVGSPFSYNSNLKKIVLPSTLTSMRELGYYGRGDTEVISKATVPPTALTRLFIQSAPSVIRVPKGSLEAYQTATNWSEWADKMVELEE